MSANWARNWQSGALLLLIVSLTACGSSSSITSTAPSPRPILTTYVTPSPAATESPQPSTPSPTSQTPEATPTPQTYIIQEGDTFLGIAERFGISLESLLAANPGVNAAFLSIGQEIALPSGEDGGVPGLATPTPLPLEVSDPACYASAAGELWCFALVENTEDELVDTVLGQVELLDAAGVPVAHAAASTLLNSLPPGAAMPLVAYWHQAPEGWIGAQATLFSAFAVADPEGRYVNVNIVDDVVEMAENGLSAHLTGEAQSASEISLVWVLAVAYDADDNVVGVRRWEGEAAAASFDFYVYSLGAPIERVELLAEARP
jgi:LysM repeat protein